MGKLAIVNMTREKLATLTGLGDTQQLYGQWAFQAFPDPEEAWHAASRAHVLILDGKNLWAISQANSGTPILALFEHGNISKMTEVMRHHPSLNHLACRSAKPGHNHLTRLLTQITDGGLWGLDQQTGLTAVERQQVHGYDEKSRILGDVAEYAARLDSFAGMQGTAMTVASELLMNAVFDAPTDGKTGLAKYASLPRSQPIKLEASEYIDVAYGHDREFLAIAVRDRFGSISRDIVAGNLHRCSLMGSDQVRKRPGGAGVGLYLLLNLCSQLDIYVVPGQSTEVVASIAISKRQRDYELRGSAINIFQGQPGR